MYYYTAENGEEIGGDDGGNDDSNDLSYYNYLEALLQQNQTSPLPKIPDIIQPPNMSRWL